MNVSVQGKVQTAVVTAPNNPKPAYLLLVLYILPSLQHFSKKDIKTLLNRQKDKPGHQGTKVIHDIIYTLKEKQNPLRAHHRTRQQ